MADQAQKLPNLRKREDHKLATTTYVNEVADAVAGLSRPPRTGPQYGKDQHTGGAPLQVSGSRSGGGIYDAVAGTWQYIVNTGAGLSLSTQAEFVDTKFPVVLINQGETGKVTHYIGAGAIVEAFPTGIVSDDHLPVYITNYSHAIRDLRYNPTTHTADKTYNDGDTVPEADWIPWMQFDPCDTTTPQVADFVMAQASRSASVINMEQVAIQPMSVLSGG